MKSQLGLTLFEILLVMLMLGLAAIPMFSNLSGSRARLALVISAEKLQNNINKAQLYAQQAKDSKTWGIIVTDGTHYRLVSGEVDQPATWDSQANQLLDEGVSFIGAYQVWFQKGSGSVDPATPNYANPIIFWLHDTGSRKAQVQVSATGVVVTKMD